ncbi:MAG: glycerophosphodiester phosphodiesterase [Calothrix sp. SM1_5_4]|nr:glycerophosphodiester phosphodiesterase [Calothrix sp. SM1_5_4]
MYLLLMFFMSCVQTALAVNALEIQGHRGARWVRPENTLPAFQYALEVGVDTLEMDTVVTKDDRVVVAHDPYLNPQICLDKNGRRIKDGILIRSLSLAELKTYDCGALVHPRFRQQTPVPKTAIPTLDEVFALAAKSSAGRRVRFNIETKIELEHPEYTPDPDRFVDLVLKVIRQHGVVERVTLQSFDYRTLKVARRREPKLNLSVLMDKRPKVPLADVAREYDATVVSPRYDWLTEKDVRELRALGLRVIPWTVNDPIEARKLIGWGVAGLITDNPAEMIRLARVRDESLVRPRKPESGDRSH